MAFSAIFFNACKKENLLVEAQPTKLNIKEDPKLLEDAKEYFTKHFGKTHSISPQTNIAASSSQTIEPISITPEWTQAVVAPYLQKYPILVVPVEDIKQFNVGTTTYKLVFFRDSLGEIQAKLNVAVPDSAYGAIHVKSNVQDFTGCFFQMDMQGKLGNLLRVKEGKFTQKGQIVFGRNTIRLSTRDGECDAPDPTSCPTWGRRSVLQVILDGLGSFAEWVANGAVTGWNGGDASNSSATGGSFNFGGGTYYDNTDGTGSSGSTSAGSTGTYPNSNYLIDEIGNEIFDLTEERATLLYINVRLSMTYQETQYLRSNREAAMQIESYLRNNTAIDGVENARSHLTLLINNIAYFSANHQANYPEIGSESWEKNVVIPYLGPELVIEYTVWCAVLKKQNPTWPAWKIRVQALWNTTKEILHTGLDICGMIPAFGEPCDLVNGVFYTIEGDGLNATLSFAATIPIAGWIATGSKYAIKTIGISGRTYKLSYRLVNGVIEFGDKDALRAQLRRILNLSSGDGMRAHHIIPLELTSSTNLNDQATKLIQKAANYKAAFHPNEFNNGIAISEAFHTGSHPNYTTRVKAALDQIFNSKGGDNISPELAHKEIQDLLTKIKTAILNNPTVNIDNLIF